MARFVRFLAIPALLTACHAAPDPLPGLRQELSEQGEAEPLRVQDTEQILPTGLMLRSPDNRKWGAHLIFPTSVSWTSFDSIEDVRLQNLSSLSVVPTGEFILPMGERWTLLPYIGAGGAFQLGQSDVAQDEPFVGLTHGGLRAQCWQPFAKQYRFILTTDVLYSLALVPEQGLLGDWGTFEVAGEIRRNVGAPRVEPRFQPGVYAQLFWYWDPIEVQIPGVTPTSVDGQVELGISLGSTKPFKLWKIPLPRVFLGVRQSEDWTQVRLRFGRL